MNSIELPAKRCNQEEEGMHRNLLPIHLEHVWHVRMHSGNQKLFLHYHSLLYLDCFLYLKQDQKIHQYERPNPILIRILILFYFIRTLYIESPFSIPFLFLFVFPFTKCIVKFQCGKSMCWPPPALWQESLACRYECLKVMNPPQVMNFWRKEAPQTNVGTLIV